MKYIQSYKLFEANKTYFEKRDFLKDFFRDIRNGISKCGYNDNRIKKYTDTLPKDLYNDFIKFSKIKSLLDPNVLPLIDNLFNKYYKSDIVKPNPIIINKDPIDILYGTDIPKPKPKPNPIIVPDVPKPIKITQPPININLLDRYGRELKNGDLILYNIPSYEDFHICKFDSTNIKWLQNKIAIKTDMGYKYMKPVNTLNCISLSDESIEFYSIIKNDLYFGDGYVTINDLTKSEDLLSPMFAKINNKKYNISRYFDLNTISNTITPDTNIDTKYHNKLYQFNNNDYYTLNVILNENTTKGKLDIISRKKLGKNIIIAIPIKLDEIK